MEKQEIQTIKNLLDSIAQGTLWELDPQLKLKILSEIEFDKFEISPKQELIYKNTVIIPLKNALDSERWENRHIDSIVSTIDLLKFNFKLLITAIKNKSIGLPDKIIVLCGAVIAINKEIDKLKPWNDKTLEPFSIENDAVLEQLPREIQRLITFYKMARRESKK